MPRYSTYYAIDIARNRLGLNDGAHEMVKMHAEREAKERRPKRRRRMEVAGHKVSAVSTQLTFRVEPMPQ